MMDNMLDEMHDILTLVVNTKVSKSTDNTSTYNKDELEVGSLWGTVEHYIPNNPTPSSLSPTAKLVLRGDICKENLGLARDRHIKIPLKP